MDSPSAALLFLLLTFAGWVSRQQRDVIVYLQEENLILREQLGGRRLRVTDAQRRRLAAKGKPVGRKALREVAGIVTPDTILRWEGKRIAWKYDGTAERGRRGRKDDTDTDYHMSAPESASSVVLTMTAALLACTPRRAGRSTARITSPSAAAPYGRSG